MELYETRWCKELGRYLVASRDIEPREIIIREDPLVSGPSDRGPKEFPVCLGCCCVMYDNPSNRCLSCHWPVCSPDCEKLPSHALNECQIFHKNRVFYPPPYGWPYISRSIMILRCLLLKTQNPTNWELLMNMSDNKEIRKCKPNCINSDKRILENFAKFMPVHEGDSQGSVSDERGHKSGENQSAFPPDAEKKRFLEEEVIRISGIIDTNAHAFPLSINGRSTFVCNIYSKTSLLAHSCRPNASWSPDKSLSSLTLTIRSNVPIRKGDMISVAYDDGQLLVCTLKRLVPNEVNGMFICNCERCIDPTEFGTYIGALKCPSCQEGYLLPIDPVDSFSSWKCDNGNSTKKQERGNGKSAEVDKNALGEGCLNAERSSDGTNTREEQEKESGNCNEVLDDESVMEIMEQAESLCGYTRLKLGPAPQNSEDEEGEGEGGHLELLKEFANEYAGNILHPNHYILQEVEVRILRAEYAKGLRFLSDSDLIQHLERCERLLRIANVLTPGFCEYRAFLQFHFSQGLLSLQRRKEERKEQQSNNNCAKHPHKAKDEAGCDDENEQFDDGDPAEKMRYESIDDDHGGSGIDDQNGNDAVSKNKTKKKNDYGKYENSQQNLERLIEMLTFLFAFFRELNPEHKLLEPIGDTLEDSEIQLEELTSAGTIESK